MFYIFRIIISRFFYYRLCNDQELIGKIDISTMIDKTWQGGRIQLVDTSGKLSEWKTVLDFDIPNSK